MTSRGAPLPPIHDALVTRLAADLRPVRRLWAPSVRLVLWLALAGAVVAGAGQLGLRRDLGAEFRQPLYILEIEGLLGGSIAAAGGALLAAVPGRQPRVLRYVALLLAVFVVTILGSELPSNIPSGRSFITDGLPCVFYVAAYGALPWAALFTMTVRAAPLNGRTVGAYAGGAAFLVGAAAVRIACPVDDPAHVLVWHMPAIVLWTMLSAAVGSLWLVFPRSAA